MSIFNLSDYISSSIIEGAPQTVSGKQTFDGSVENIANYAQKSRKEINYHNINGTDISAIINSFVSGVAGSGINIQSRLPDKKINTEFETLLKYHGKGRNFDVTGRSHRNEFFRNTIGYDFLNGGVIIRHHYNATWDIPYRSEMVGVDMIDTAKSDNKYLQNGIQKNRYGRITKLWLYTDLQKIESKPFSMKNMTYYMNPWISISQYTAVSRLVTILPTLDNVLEYSTAEVKAALERAKAGVYWSTELYGTILQALNDEFNKANATPTEKIAEAKVLLEKLSQRGVSATGATPIPMDDKIYQVDNKTDSVYDTITNQSQKSMASSVGGSPVSIYRDISLGNYASIKAAISFDEEQYKIEFDRLVNKVINEYLERLFMVGVQIGAISVSREDYFSNREKYHSWEVLRQSKRVIDEVKAATARAKDLESGSTTHIREYGEQGKDYLTEMERQADADVEVELMRKAKYEAAGLEYPPAQTKDKTEEVEEKPDETQNGDSDE